MTGFWKKGEPFVWATGLTLSLVLLLTILLLYVVIVNGAAVFWPSRVAYVELTDSGHLIGEITQKEYNKQTEKLRYQLKIGNRELYGLDFRWVDGDQIKSISYPENIIALEREEYGNFYGFIQSINEPGSTLAAQPEQSHKVLKMALEVSRAQKLEIEKLNEVITSLNNKVARVQDKLNKLKYQNRADSPEAEELRNKASFIKKEFDQVVAALNDQRQEALKYKAIFKTADDREKEIALINIVRFYEPNKMGVFQKISFYFSKVWELFTADPRESNTEGGLFPAIFGTIMLVFVMSILSFPLGVLAGIYLREYAKEGILVKMVRIAVNNLAGIPSIVYGIFGLGFFIYGIGSTIDQIFFPERLPTPTFGTGGILWASLTLGLLTVPVVIVATEEALGSIPPGIREGSQALAATKFQTLTKLLLPMASPGIMTGFILAMARAGGEVAPLMITGVVKLAPALPIDGNFPYIHLDRKFMHLGFHIYDIGFQSPNVEAAKPMVYVTTFLLILIVLIMTSTAIYLRNKMRKRYSIVDV